MGARDNPHFAIRIPRDKLDKLKYIAEYNARSANREIEVIVSEYISKFENEHGKITLDE